MTGSLAVMLAAPLIALPIGQAGESSDTSVIAQGTPLENAVAAADASPVEPTHKTTAHVEATDPVTEPAKPPSPAEQVSIACASDGCVVQSGLDIVILGGDSAPRAPHAGR
ncbi:MAG: hypothetical protein U0271_11865 [Polyangiaceae bacterium]